MKFISTLLICVLKAFIIHGTAIPYSLKQIYLTHEIPLFLIYNNYSEQINDTATHYTSVPSIQTTSNSSPYLFSTLSNIKNICIMIVMFCIQMVIN